MSILGDIQARKTGFYFRKAIPLDIRSQFGGKREIVLSLGKDSSKAKVQGRVLSLQVEGLFVSARDSANGGLIEQVALPTNPRKKAKAAIAPADLKLSEAVDAYQLERKLPPKTMIEYRAALRRFVEIVDDKPIRAIAKGDARLFKATLLKLPKSPPRKLRGASVTKIIAAVGSDPTVVRVSAKTVQKTMGAISAVLGWCEANGLIETNPFSKVKVLLPANAAPGRLPYSSDDLKAIFASPIFKGCESEARRGQAGDLIIRDHSFWLPWLGLYSGARLEEMCQSLLTDVRQVDGVNILDINTLDAGKHVKTAGSVRCVPIHPKLIELGFLDYVAGLRVAGETQLFPKLKRDNRGNLSAMWSKFWGRYARNVVGITDSRKVFHSFRHAFKDACRAAQISEEVHDALTGHSSGSVGRSYGVGVPLSVLQKELARVRFASTGPS